MSSKLPWRLIIRPSTRCPRCYNHPPRLLQFRPASTAQVGNHIAAAPPIDLSNLPPPNPQNARVVPASPSYFTSRPRSTDNYLSLLSLLRKYQTLPTVGPGQAPRVAWRTTTQYRLMVGENVRSAKYNKIIQVLQRLNRIHPSVMPASLKKAMEPYKRDIDPYAVTKRPSVIDEDGRAYGVGRRKSSSAKVYLVQGEGKVLVNGKSINSAFGRIHDRESALWALKVTGRLDKYNVWALVSGGGLTGQAEAMTLGAAKALMVFEPALKPALRRGERSLLRLRLYVDLLMGGSDSWLCYEGSEEGGEEEAWTCEGKEDACLGEEVNVCSAISLRWFIHVTFSPERWIIKPRRRCTVSRAKYSLVYFDIFYHDKDQVELGSMLVEDECSVGRNTDGTGNCPFKRPPVNGKMTFLSATGSRSLIPSSSINH